MHMFALKLASVINTRKGYSGTPILRYGKGQQNHIAKSRYRCEQTPDLPI